MPRWTWINPSARCGTRLNANRIKAQLKSADVLVARVYVGAPLLAKTLVHVTHDTSEGWC